MNRSSITPITFLILSIILITGCEEPPFKGYVKGEVVCAASQYNLGFFEFHVEGKHDFSYMAIYNEQDCPNCKLEDIKYFQVKNIKGVPHAYTIKDDVDETDLNKLNPTTKINYHCFYKDRDHEIHRIGHIRPNSVSANSNGTFDIEISGENFNGNFRIGAIAKAIGDATAQENKEYSSVYYLEKNDTLIDIDLCHYHAERLIHCYEIGQTDE